MTTSGDIAGISNRLPLKKGKTNSIKPKIIKNKSYKTLTLKKFK